MYIGPKLQEDIFTVIIRWSFFQFAFTCDVVKMFRQFLVAPRQFLVAPSDRDWQRILWRKSSNAPMQTFRLKTVTYGTASAPFLANACMLRLADKEQENFPQGAYILRKNRYADDFFAGGDTLEEAMAKRNELTSILASGGMEVGRWASNTAALLDGLGSTEIHKVLEIEETVSALGIKWQASVDNFLFNVSEKEKQEKVTKRTILSDTASLCDPLGWLSPVIIRPKILLQNLWVQGATWDELVSSETEKS